MSGAAALVFALRRMASAAGLDATFASESVRSWASATYVGARHRIACIATDDAERGAFLTALPDADFTLAGHLVAALAIEDAGPDRATIVALTLVAD